MTVNRKGLTMYRQTLAIHSEPERLSCWRRAAPSQQDALFFLKKRLGLSRIGLFFLQAHDCQGRLFGASLSAMSSLTIMGLQKEWQGSANGEKSPLALLLANIH